MWWNQDFGARICCRVSVFHDVFFWDAAGRIVACFLRVSFGLDLSWKCGTSSGPVWCLNLLIWDSLRTYDWTCLSHPFEVVHVLRSESARWMDHFSSTVSIIVSLQIRVFFRHDQLRRIASLISLSQYGYAPVVSIQFHYPLKYPPNMISSRAPWSADL